MRNAEVALEMTHRATPLSLCWRTGVMTYRDERDALRERVENLEEDLGEAERKLAEHKASEDKRARVEQIEQRMNEARRELDVLARELAAVRGDKPAPPRSNNARIVAVVGASVGMLVAGAVVAFVAASRPAPVRVAHDDGSRQAATVEAPVPPVPAPEPAPQPEPPRPPPAPTREVTATWTGKVTRASGLPIGPGGKCVIEAQLSGDGQKARVEELEVQCGGRSVYRSTDKLEGMSMNGAGLAEVAGKEPGTFAYAVRYTDTGSRAGPRTQISLDTTQGAGAAWSEVVPIFRVEFSVPAESAPVKGERLLDKDKP